MNQVRDEDLKFQVNELLSKLGGPKRVSRLSDFDAAFFVELYEGLFSEPLPDVIRSPKCKEDLIHNVQSVIDAISLDIINTSLSHISGEAIVNGDKVALKSLIDVFTWLVDFILEKIGTDTSTEGDPDDREPSFDDPDLVTPEVIDSILEKELSGNTQNYGTKDQQWNQSKSEHGSSKLYSLCSDKTEDLIALGDSRYIRTPSEKGNNKKVRIKEVDKQSERLSPPVGIEWSVENDTPLETGDLENDRISDQENRNGSLSRKNESIERKYGSNHSSRRPNDDLSVQSEGSLASESSRVRHDTLSSIADSMHFPEPVSIPDQERTTEFDLIGVRSEEKTGLLPTKSSTETASQPNSHQQITHHLYHHYDPHRDPLASSLPLRSSVNVKDTGTSPSVPDPLSASLPVKSINKGVKNSTTSRLEPGKSSVKGSLSSTYPPKSSFSYKRTSPKSQSVTYDNLRSLVQETAAMAQSAVRTSPLRSRDTTANSVDVTDRDLSNRLREGLREISYNTTSDFSSRNSSYNKSNSKGILSPPRKTTEKAQRKVSFLTSRSTSDDTEIDDILSSDTSGTHGKLRQRQSNYLDKIDRAGPDNLRPSSQKSRDRTRRSKPARSLLDEAVEELTLPRAQAYWQKYYGTSSRRRVPTVTSDDESYHSDGMVDYGQDESNTEDDAPVRTQFDKYKVELRARAKQVRFDDKMDNKAKGHIGVLRRKHKKEDQKVRVRTEFLNDLYEGELEDYGIGMEDIMKKAKTESNKKDSEYKRKVLNAPKKKYSAGRKYAAQTSVAVPKKVSRGRSQQKPRTTRGRIRSSSASPTIGRADVFPENEILPWLIEEFPYLHLSKETLHSLWRKSSRQIEQLSKVDQEIQRKKSKAQVQVENAEKKHKILANIMKKEISHNRRVQEIDNRRKQQHQVKSTIRDKRMASANTRRYYDEYQVRMRSKMLKKRTKEEQIFRKLFDEGLKIQKEQVRDMRKYHRDQKVVRSKKQQDYIDSMENYYKDQFSMLTEAMSTEIEDRNVRSKAQDKVLGKMKKELRSKLEGEIKDIQEQLYRDEDDAYWRELDAERLKQRLRTARHQYKI